MLGRRSLSSLNAAILTLALFGTSALADEHAAQRLIQRMNAFSSLRADVEQLIIESDGGVLETSSIRMLLKKPNGFSWETLDPFPELLVTNGEWLWNYQPDLEQVVIEPWSIEESGFAARLLAGDSTGLDTDYRISVGEGASAELIDFRLEPVDPAALHSRIDIGFVGEALDSIVLSERSGQRTVWRFTNLVSSPSIEDKEFNFTPPPEVEVINNDYR